MITDIEIEPVNGRFDVAQIETHLVMVPFATRDASAPHTFLAASSSEELAEAKAKRIEEPGRFPTNVTIVTIHAHRIGIAQWSPLETIRQFVQWIRKRHELRFSDNDYVVSLPDVDEDLVKLFGKLERPRVTRFDRDGIDTLHDNGVVRPLITALMSPNGNAWFQQLKTGNMTEARFSSTLHATRAGDAWRIVRDDLEAELTLTPAEIEKLLDDALALRHQFRLENFPIGETLDERYVIDEDLYGESDRGLYAGRDRERDAEVLISLCLPQSESLERVRQRLAYDAPGITPLRHVGPITSDTQEPRHGLIEDRPPGAPWSGANEEPEPVARRVVAVAEIVAGAHARGIVLVGLRPELVFFDGDRISGIAPRCDPFHLGMKKVDHGVGFCFSHTYVAPEVLVKPHDPASPAADVFSLAAMLACWHTGSHPFRGESGANILSVTAGQRARWTGDTRVGAIVDAGLAPVAKRMPLDKLVSALHDLSR